VVNGVGVAGFTGAEAGGCAVPRCAASGNVMKPAKRKETNTNLSGRLIG
jgi:hypothetical protein